MLNRRALLSSAVAAGAATMLPLTTQAQSGQAAGGKPARLNALYDRMFQAQLDLAPEGATGLGLDVGPRAHQKSELSDASVAGDLRGVALARQGLTDLRAIGRAGLSGMDVVNYDTIEYVLDERVSNAPRFNYGSRGQPYPYVLSQLTGNYQSTPDFLDSQHKIDTAADAQAYLSRLEAFGRSMRQENERAREDGGRGVVPPDFIIDKALTQMRQLRDTPTATTTLVASLVRRAGEKNLSGDWGARAGRIVDSAVKPALAEQIALLEGWRPRAVHTAGVSRLPQGDAYYAFGAKAANTTTLTGDEIHRLGLTQVAELTARADTILRAQGLTQGTVAQRISTVHTRDGQVYPNTDAAKVQLLADLNTKVREVTARLPQYFGALPHAGLEIRRVPVAIEAGAPGGYYQTGTLDGSRPGAYYINLRDTAEVPKFSLPTLTFHEGIPGHHLQGTLALEAQGLPLIRKVMFFSGYGEGWALYAEQLADEMGMYENDPFGKVGYLQSLLFRAARLVVDSGLHSKGWSREQAIRYMVDTTGDEESSMTTEVERYCVWPGQATSYKIGHTKWNELREGARRTLGARFDIKRFHDAGLLAGAMPLAVLERRIADWTAGERRA